MPKLRGKYRWQLLLRAADRTSVHAAAETVRVRAAEISMDAGVTVRIDVDPLQLL